MELKRGYIFLYINNIFSRAFESKDGLDEFINKVYQYDDWKKIKSNSDDSYEYRIYVSFKNCQTSFIYWKTWTGLKDKDNNYIFFGDEVVDREGNIWNIQDTPDDYPYCKGGWYLVNYPSFGCPRKKGIPKETTYLNDFKVVKTLNEKWT